MFLRKDLNFLGKNLVELKNGGGHVHGFKPKTESPYDECGRFLLGKRVTSSDVMEYHNEIFEWHKNNPTPIKLVNYSTESSPAYILATKCIKSISGKVGCVGMDFLSDTEFERKLLDGFMRKYNIAPQGEIGWWLSSYYDS
jgi:hypothetical protein